MRSDTDLVMPLSEHLGELRGRLVKSLVAVAVGFTIAYNWADLLFAFITRPLRALGYERATFIGTGVAEAFFTKLKVSVIAGIFLVSPVILYQIWRFVAPGLYAHERRHAVGFVTFGTLCFFLGAAFCYEVIFTVGYGFFLEEYRSMGIDPALRISEYVAFSSRLLLAFGCTFELPVLAFFLARVGVVTPEQLIAWWRYAIVGVFIVAAVLTPPDVASQLLMAGPLLALYVISIGVARIAQRGRPLADATTNPEPAP
jgi:sec-independent protein translocase protein TatC